jgi:hypothetical protein
MASIAPFIVSALLLGCVALLVWLFGRARSAIRARRALLGGIGLIAVALIIGSAAWAHEPSVVVQAPTSAAHAPIGTTAKPVQRYIASTMLASTPMRLTPVSTPMRRATDKPPAVVCWFSQRDAARAAAAFVAKNRQLLDQIAVGCHIIPDAPNGDCTFAPRPVQQPGETRSPPQECLPRGPPHQFAIYNRLWGPQLEQWVYVTLNDVPIGVIHVYDEKPAAMLIVAVPEAGVYTYGVRIETRYDLRRHPPDKPRSGSGSLLVVDGSFFELVHAAENEREVWLEPLN